MNQWIAFGLLTLLSHCVYSQERWRDPAFIEQAFLAVALRNEYSSGEKPLSKWREPLRIYFQHQVTDDVLHEQLARDHLQHLTQLTGHPIEIVNQKTQANVIWVFTEQSKWATSLQELGNKPSSQPMHRAICQANYTTNLASEIISASIVIPVDQAREHGKLLACIVEEITQVMGLPNDSELAYPSIFNDKTPEDLLSPLDVILLRLLYQPELISGMKQPQVQIQIRNQLKRYQQQGILEKAVQDARSSPLYEWLR